MTALTVLATLAAAGAAVGLWVGARRHGATVARGYRWLSGAALFLCVGLILQLVMAGSLAPSTAPSLVDVAPLLALALTAIGIMVLASPVPAEASAPSQDAAGGRGSILPVSVLPGLADGYVTAVSLLVMGWIVAFGTEYHTSGERPGAFLLDLLHPLADLAVLGALLPVLTVAWQRTLLPYLALLAATGADSLGVGARISGGHEGVLEQLALIAAAALLGVSPWARPLAARFLPVSWLGEGTPVLGAPVADGTGQGGTGQGGTLPESAAPGPGVPHAAVSGPGAVTGAGVATIIAALTAGIAALVVVINGLASGPASGLALVIAGGAAVLVVTVRVLMLVRENGVALRMWRESASSLRDLASRTSDMVMICDFDGTIGYASPGGASFSYPPDELAGRRLAEFVHPEDIPVARAVIRQAVGLPYDIDPVGLAGVASGAAQTLDAGEEATAPDAARGRFSGRLRAADGTWRHVEYVVLPYQVPGEPARMLVTARDVSDEVALRNQVAHLTFHDGLTGLPNRAYLEDRVRVALAEIPVPEAGITGVIFLDLDRFTGVNDSEGHGAGDLVLAQAGRLLRATVPVRYTVARWGGDEFAVLVEHSVSVSEVTELAERLAAAIAGTQFKVADREIGLTASVGVALTDADTSERSPDLLLRNADVAMSRAKAGGGDQVEVFAEHMHADVVHRMQLASDLKRALDRDELTLVYQPVVELATSRIIGAEALVRWNRDGTEVAVREFLDVAENSGLSGALGEWVLRRACGQAARWRAEGWDIHIAANIAPRQLAAARFPAELAAVLADTGLPPSALTIEVNEGILVEGKDQVTSRLTELRALGVRLAIDDFGTGYASLAYLREFPVDIIKIDPSFISGLGNDPTLTLLTRTIVQVGRDLGIEVVAEGIEQPGQLAELKEMGCVYGQGFLMARPMPADGLEAMLRTAAVSQPPRSRVTKAGAA